jgi:vitamin B12 transporter
VITLSSVRGARGQAVSARGDVHPSAARATFPKTPRTRGPQRPLGKERNLANLRHLLATSALSIAAVLPLASPVSAQDDVTYLGEIVLSALRTAAERLSTGVSVSVLTEEDLAQDRSAKLADTLARLPGLSFSQTGPVGSSSALRIRGLDGRYLAVYVDGIRVSDPSGTTVSFDFGSLLSSDIGRVEVLRGSQSALWGGSAVAGVINISTLAALEDGTHQTAAIEGGSYGTARLGWGLTHKDDRSETVLSITRFHTDGFSATDAGDEADGADIARLSFSHRYKVSDVLDVGGAVFVQDNSTEYDPSSTLDGAGYDIDSRDIGARVFAELDAGNTIHSFDITAYDLKRTYAEPGDVNSYKGKRLTLSWQGVTTVSDALSFVYGADWSRETADYTNLPTGSADTTIYGAFGQVIWSPSEAFDLSATLRADHDSSFGTFPTGRLALAWSPSDSTTLHASIGRGFRAPSIDERFGFYPSIFGDFIGNPDLEPEKSWSYEIGVEQQLANGGSLSATAFRIEIDNLVTYAFDPVLSTLENVPGESVSQGVELAANLPLSDSVTLGLAYTYTDARRPTGARLTRVPQNLLSLSLNADLSDRLSMGLTAVHSAGMKDNDPATFALVDAPDYTVLNAQANYSLTDSMDVYLRIENLTDEDYTTALGYNAPGRSAYLGLQAKF